MSINNLFERKRLRFFGISSLPDRETPTYKNGYQDLHCRLCYKVVDGSNKEITFIHILGNSANSKDRASSESEMKGKIYRLQTLFSGNTTEELDLSSEIKFANLVCTGIFYNDELIAITNDEGEKCLDPLLKNEVKDIDEFKKEFIKLKEVELEKERHMCEKRAEEICAEISHIIQHTS